MNNSSTTGKIVFEVLKRIFAGVLAFVASNFVCGLINGYLNMKKIEASTGKNNSVQTEVFEKEEIRIKEDTDNVYISSYTSILDVICPVPEKDVLNIEITACFSNIKIYVPSGVNILGASVQINTDELGDDAPEIRFNIKSAVTKIQFVTA